jgi:hypothetical protein
MILALSLNLGVKQTRAPTSSKAMAMQASTGRRTVHGTFVPPSSDYIPNTHTSGCSAIAGKFLHTDRKRGVGKVIGPI